MPIFRGQIPEIESKTIQKRHENPPLAFEIKLLNVFKPVYQFLMQIHLLFTDLP
jgi:hypothetical protein